MKKLLTKDLIVFWIALAALVLAVLSLNASLNKLVDYEEE